MTQRRRVASVPLFRSRAIGGRLSERLIALSLIALLLSGCARGAQL